MIDAIELLVSLLLRSYTDAGGLLERLGDALYTDGNDLLAPLIRVIYQAYDAIPLT